MNRIGSEWIHRYFDGQITQAELSDLEAALSNSPELRREMVQTALLEEKLSQAFRGALNPVNAADVLVDSDKSTQSRRRFSNGSSPVVLTASLLLLFLGLLFLSNRNQLGASQEFNRILKSLSSGDRLYRVDVEQVVLPSKKQLEKHDRTRPPKPTLDGAKLYLRGSDQFVLMRFRDDGMPFVTGSDGQIGWAIAPNGPVRTSYDTQAFNHDLPGHEHSIPLANLSQGLTQIQKAYAVQIIPTASNQSQEEQDSILIATKRSGERGPKRIEIQYDAQSGRIAQMRFIDMPYGPERLTVRLTLQDELSLPATFFHHSHHRSTDQEALESKMETP